jgi:hypothetical protein
MVVVGLVGVVWFLLGFKKNILMAIIANGFQNGITIPI